VRQSRKQKEIEARRAADPLSQVVGRVDIDYGSDDLPTAPPILKARPPADLGPVAEIQHEIHKRAFSPEHLIDDLLVMLRPTNGWNIGLSCVDDAFVFLAQARQNDPNLVLTLSVCDEMRRRGLL
jgi:hypothetical protein